MSDDIEREIASLSVSDTIDLSLLWRQTKRFEAAIVLQMRAVSLEPLNPRAHVALAESLLLRDEYRAGFLEHQWRLLLEAPGNIPAFSAAPWTGYAIPAPGRLMVVADQGFGDNMMFSRFLPWALDRCTQMVVVVSPELESLFTDPRWDVCSEWRSVPGHAAHVRMSSLPMLAGTTFESIPRSLSWSMIARSTAIELPGNNSPPGRPLIGFCWRGQENHQGQIERSVPFDRMRSLITLPTITPVCLQFDPAEHERAIFPPYQAALADWTDTAFLISELDLVITSDTAVAHLAGTLGVRTWVMLKHDADWRYGLHRDWNAWYPSQRLFRQTIPGDWSHVIAEVRDALAAG